MRSPSWQRFVQFFFENLASSLCGITWDDWLRLLRDNRCAVDLRYAPRAVTVTLCSLRNSFWRCCEDALYRDKVRSVQVQPPLFILGHWRTGTTHLHNLLAVDRRFAFPNNYQVMYPHSFLCLEAHEAWAFDRMIPERRPQDNVALGAALPQEDEFALKVLTGCSSYMGWVFPRRMDYYQRYLTFRGVPEEELRRWKKTLVWFLKKVTWKYGRPLLLKSPPHTARIRLLLEMFPEARFVHIHRNPFTVFQSTKHTLEKIMPSMQLHAPRRLDTESHVLACYHEMYEAFFAERGLIPPGRYHEVGFEELENDPLGQMKALYERLGLDGFTGVEPALLEYLASQRDYRKNEFRTVAEPLRERIATTWRRSFVEWGYPS
jgi:omega-hydroxy-beta-dihydromenaquinone-9 sulfotransferase